jgi:phosphoribosylformimino-5-aminoimidazole carboxamide ribotide isomerase
VGSALFNSLGGRGFSHAELPGLKTRPPIPTPTPSAAEFSGALGADRLIAAIDSRAGRIVINGWKTSLDITPEDAARQLDPYVGTFLYTHVDTEGLLGGINMNAVRSVAAATTRKLIAAGGISTQQEVDALDALGIDAVVGMALYAGQFEAKAEPPAS